MAGWIIAFHCLMRLKEPLISTVSCAEWHNYKFGSSNKKKKDAPNHIVNDPKFWQEVCILVQAMYPVLRVLRLADSNSAGMDKLYYYVRQTMVALEKSRETLNGNIVCGLFALRPQDVRLFNLQGQDKPYNLDEEDPDLDLEHDASDYDIDVVESEDDDNSDASNIRRPLGDCIMLLWEARAKRLSSDFAVLGWMVSVVPAIRLDAASFMASHKAQAINVLRKLWYTQGMDEI